MGAAIVKQSTLAMTGAVQLLPLGFVPDLVVAWLENGTTAQNWVCWTPTAWLQRVQLVGTSSSAGNALCGMIGTDMVIGTSPEVNVANATLHYVAIADNGSGLFSSTGWMGSPAAWSPVVGSSAPAAVIVERDASRPPCFRSADMTGASSIVFDGTGLVSDGITAINADGTIGVGTGAYVNELSGGALGEGHDALAFWAVPGLCQPVVWTGDGTTNRTIPHAVANAAFAIVIGNAAGTKGGMKLATMGTKMVHAAATAGIDNVMTSLSGGLTLGSDTRYNAATVTYRAIVIGTQAGRQAVDVPPSTGKAVLIRGSASSAINCGTDASLSMTGAFSLEWWGRLLPSQSANPMYLMARSAGDEGRADSDGLQNGAGTRLDGTWSWALGAHRFADIPDWAGPQFFVCTTNYNNYGDFSGSENNIRTKPWRTGIVVPRGPFHVVVTHDGFGRWNLYLNGRLVKQRLIDMRGVTLADDAGARVNAGAGIGHRTVLGARQGTSAIGQLSRQTIRGARVYASALTQGQVAQVYGRNFLGKALAEVTPVEEWLAANASGATLTATVNAANNGAMTSGYQVGARYL